MKRCWETKRLGEIIQLEYGKPLSDDKRTPDGKYPVYGANGEKDRTNEFYHDKPSIIVGRKGSAGEVNLTEKRFWPLDVTYFVTFDEKKYNLKFLFNLLLTLGLPKLAKGVKPGINRNEVYGINVKAPLLPEQERIAGLIDDVFEKTTKAKEIAERNLQNARELFESYLQSVFANQGTGWEEKELGDDSIIEIIDGDRGINYPKKSDFSDAGFCLFLNTKNVRPDGFCFDEVMFVSKEKDNALRKGKLQRNDVILTTRGTIGNLAVYDNEVPYDNVRINSGMLIFRPNTKKLLPSFLFEILRSGIIKTQIARHVSGAAQPQLPIKTLVNFKIPVPRTVDVQAKIVASLKEIGTNTKRLEVIYQQKLADLEELKKSVLHNAFNGELAGACS